MRLMLLSDRHAGVATGTPWLVTALTVALCLPLSAHATQTAAGLPAAIEAALVAPGPLHIDGTQVNSDDLRPTYEHRGYAPLWITAPGGTDEHIQAVAAVLAQAASEGLDPQWYHAEAISRRIGAADAREIVQLELLLSDGALAYAQHEKWGVRPPAPGDPEMAFEQPPYDPEEVLLAIASAPDPADYLHAIAPAHASYRGLRSALELYRRIEKDGGWSPLPDGPTLRVGMSSVAVPPLRRRLAVTGELDSGVTDSRKYDATLVAAVKRFQQRNGLPADGALGAATREALNVPVERRIEQIIVNMERWRWLNSALGERYVKVNVPAFMLDLVDGGQSVLSMPVVVGKTSLRTPMFSSEISQLVFNPSWFVPPKIAREEILPKARQDPQYLSREGFIVRRVGGSSAPAGAGEPNADATTRLRQAPGPLNPLGRIKFNMPNAFGVYLHDTPSRRSFARQKRALSHGCVRLSKPLVLADALMTDVDGWNDRRKSMLSTWQTRRVTLRKPLPVHVLYETAWSDESGALHFRPDLYGRDETLARQMAEPRMRPASVARRATDAQAAVAAPEPHP